MAESPFEDYSYSFESSEDEKENAVAEKEINGDAKDELPEETKSSGSLDTKKTTRLGNVRFKDVASTVQTLQSASREFKSSKDIRDMVHKKWLRDKETFKEHKKNEKKEGELAKIEKKLEVEKMQKSMIKVDLWTSKKKISIQNQAKLRAEEAKKKELEEQEKQEKIQVAKTTAEMWRKEKMKELVRSHKESSRKKEEVDKLKIDQAIQKEQESKSAYHSWKKQKDTLLKKKSKKAHREQDQLQKEKAQARENSSRGSKEVVKHWLVAKNKELRINKTLFTYKDSSKRCVHEKPWRPARSVQYGYPKERSASSCQHSRPGSRSAASTAQSTANNTDTYSNASFESEEESEQLDISAQQSSYNDSLLKERLFSQEPGDVNSSSDKSSEEEGSEVKVHAPIDGTGKLKSVQVCCQLVQYWCVCPESN